MKIIVVGAGVVGISVAEQLSAEGHQVAIVDSDRSIVRELNETMEVLAVAGNGASPAMLESLGVRDADMVIAATSHDEVNMVVGMLAARFGVKKCVVRVRNTEFVKDDCIMPLGDLGITNIVNPEPFIVASLEHMMHFPGAYDFATLAGGQVQMFGFRVADNSPAIGRTLAEIRELGSLNAFLVLYITREGKVFVPRGDDSIEKGDAIHILTSSETVQFILPIVHPDADKTQNVVIVGASRIGMELSQRLNTGGRRVTLIEPNHDKAQEAADFLVKVNVLHGDPTDTHVLEEAAIDDCDVFCAMSDDDQVNMLTSLLAKKHKVSHTAALVRHPEFVSVLDSLGIDIVISPRLAIVGEILQHVRRGHIFSVTQLVEGRGEILEMEAEALCPATRHPIKELKFPKQAIVGAVVNDDGMQIPNGDTQIKAGDRVLIYTMPEAIPRIEKLFCQR